MPDVSPAVFYLLPGFGFGLVHEGKDLAYRAEASLVGLKQLAVQTSRLIFQADELPSPTSGADHATKLYALWLSLESDEFDAEQTPLHYSQEKPVPSLDLTNLSGGTDGIRQRNFGISKTNLLAALNEAGCAVVPDAIPPRDSPVHFLSFFRHPCVTSDEHGVIGEGKGSIPSDGEMGALCEGIERVLAMKPDYKRSVVGHSASSLRRQGIAVPKIEAGLRDCYSDELLTDWVEAKLFPNIQACLPAELVWFHYTPRSGFRAFDMRHTIGLAAGASEAEAFSNGLLECIERDAYALLMRCRLPCPAISANDIAACGDDVAALLARLDEEGIEVHFKWIQVDYPIPIAHVFFRDRLNRIPAHSHGCSAALTPTHAISRALFEAVQMHHGLARFAAVHWEKMASRIETCHSHPRYAWGDPLYSATLQHLANTAETPILAWHDPALSIEALCEQLSKSGRRIFWSVLGEAAGLKVIRVFLEDSVSPDNRQEDNSARLAYWVRRCKIPGPYTDPILT